jgi:hypothetical protein
MTKRQSKPNTAPHSKRELAMVKRWKRGIAELRDVPDSALADFAQQVVLSVTAHFQREQPSA